MVEIMQIKVNATAKSSKCIIPLNIGADPEFHSMILNTNEAANPNKVTGNKALFALYKPK